MIDYVRKSLALVMMFVLAFSMLSLSVSGMGDEDNLGIDSESLGEVPEDGSSSDLESFAELSAALPMRVSIVGTFHDGYNSDSELYNIRGYSANRVLRFSCNEERLVFAALYNWFTNDHKEGPFYQSDLLQVLRIICQNPRILDKDDWLAMFHSIAAENGMDLSSDGEVAIIRNIAHNNSMSLPTLFQS